MIIEELYQRPQPSFPAARVLLARQAMNQCASVKKGYRDPRAKDPPSRAFKNATGIDSLWFNACT